MHKSSQEEHILALLPEQPQGGLPGLGVIHGSTVESLCPCMGSCLGALQQTPGCIFSAAVRQDSPDQYVLCLRGDCGILIQLKHQLRHLVGEIKADIGGCHGAPSFQEFADAFRVTLGGLLEPVQHGRLLGRRICKAAAGKNISRSKTIAAAKHLQVHRSSSLIPGLQCIGAQLRQGLILFCRGGRCCRFFLCRNRGHFLLLLRSLRFGFLGRFRSCGLRGFRPVGLYRGRGFGFRCSMGGDSFGFFLLRQRAAVRFQTVFAKFRVFVQQQSALIRVLFHGPIGKGNLSLFGEVFRDWDQHIFPEQPVDSGVGGVAAVQPLDHIQPANIAQLGRCGRQFTPLQHRHKLPDPNTGGIANRLCRSRKECVTQHPAEPGDGPGTSCIIRLCQFQQDHHVQRLLAVFRCVGQ